MVQAVNMNSLFTQPPYLLQVEPCDIFFTRGYGFFSKMIRWDESVWDYNKAKINHVGLIVESGQLLIANGVEALRTVQKHPIYDYYQPKKDMMAIFRPLGLTDEEKEFILTKGLSYVGAKYGYSKILGHSLDFFTGGHYIFRRLFNSDNYPICSWLVAHAYKAANLNFGCDPGMATPDNIWDFCIDNTLKYQQILQLVNL
jgi:hypothetical protein